MSRSAAQDLFGLGWEADPRWRLLYCGVDFAPFATAPSGASHLRAELGIPADSFIVGHVGRLAPQKNHRFLLEVFRELLNRKPNAYLLLVGEGELRAEIEAKIQSLNLGDRVILTGLRNDVVSLMQSAMDCFCFPSRYEGLGLVAIEAQAAGLPCLLSEAIPPEALLVPEAVMSLSLGDSAQRWAEVLATFSHRGRLGFPSALQASPVSIENNVLELEALYRDCTARI